MGNSQYLPDTKSRPKQIEKQISVFTDHKYKVSVYRTECCYQCINKRNIWVILFST